MRSDFSKIALSQRLPWRGVTLLTASLACLLTLSTLDAWNSRSAPLQAEAVKTPIGKPNIILIVGEGHGWSSTSVNMDDSLKGAHAPVGLTPNLEKLSAAGVRMSAFYASCPRCTPSRASFFTGISPTKLHMTYVNEGGQQKRRGGRGGAAAQDAAPVVTKLLAPSPLTELPSGIKTTGDLLRTAGYATAHFGKWHIGRIDPTNHGFDESDGANTNAGPGNNRTPNPGEGVAITDRGIAFIEKHVKDGKPFFLQIDHYGGGTEAEVTPESYREVTAMGGNLKPKQVSELGVIHDMDKQIGRIQAEIEKLHLSGNTYILYTADHGTPGYAGNPPLKRGKGSVQEGGVRVPLLVRGPGIRAGSTSSVRAIGWDLLPTFAEIAGVRPPDAVEGGSLKAVWAGGKTVKRPSEEIVIHFPHYDLDNGGPASALYLGKYKLIRSYETGVSSLYDIVADPTESKDLAQAEPARVIELGQKLDAYLKSVNAQMPSANPAYQPGITPAAPQDDPRGGRGGRGGRKAGGGALP